EVSADLIEQEGAPGDGETSTFAGFDEEAATGVSLVITSNLTPDSYVVIIELQVPGALLEAYCTAAGVVLGALQASSKPSSRR
ncbi:MAG: hypothetical protein AAB316_22325, partial [Bacteroidota bacterium]